MSSGGEIGCFAKHSSAQRGDGKLWGQDPVALSEGWQVGSREFLEHSGWLGDFLFLGIQKERCV
jgi:hypothetical protein